MDRLIYYKTQLEDEDFQKISDFIEKNYGIKLPRIKKAMVQNRLYKRLIEKKIPTFKKYVFYIFSPLGKTEIPFMVDELTTNKTDFFREPKHFEFLEKNILTNTDKRYNFWCAGCSTGEEPYTLAMILKEKNIFGEIFATDLSTKVLEIAKKATYSDVITNVIPIAIKNKYFTTQIIDNKIFYQANEIIKKTVKFQQLNFLDSNYNIQNVFDVIFFRNVLIYFNIENQNLVLNRVIQFLKEGGHLFIGHSETIYNSNLGLKNVSSSVYQKIK